MLGAGRLKGIVLVALAGVLGTCSPAPTLLEEIKAAGELRAVTRNGPTTYYTSGAGPVGLEYDLLKGFADSLGVRLRIIVVERPRDVLPAVASGRAHIGAAGLAVQSDPGHRVEFGPAFQQVTEHLVYREGRRRPKDLRQLQGKRLEIASGSNYLKTLSRAQALHPDLVWSENPHADPQDLLQRVAQGSLDYTVIKSDTYAMYRSYIPQLRVAFNLAEGESIGWALPRRSDTSLRDAVTRYFSEIRASGRLNEVLDHYYGHIPRAEFVGTQQFTRDIKAKLPAYRDLFEDAADRYGIDWRLLAAIGYQESTWDPDAVSPTGVRGLMMLTEETAATFDIADRTDAAASIHGGARLFALFRRQLPGTIAEPDRTWFALAAYNLGLGHVLDARRITRSKGGNWDKWQDVRPNVRLLADPRYAARTRHGFARGGEALAFVNNVRTYHNVLQWVTREEGGDSPIWTQKSGALPAMEAHSRTGGAVRAPRS